MMYCSFSYDVHACLKLASGICIFVGALRETLAIIGFAFLCFFLCITLSLFKTSLTQMSLSRLLSNFIFFPGLITNYDIQKQPLFLAFSRHLVTNLFFHCSTLKGTTAVSKPYVVVICETLRRGPCSPINDDSPARSARQPADESVAIQTKTVSNKDVRYGVFLDYFPFIAVHNSPVQHESKLISVAVALQNGAAATFNL